MLKKALMLGLLVSTQTLADNPRIGKQGYILDDKDYACFNGATVALIEGEMAALTRTGSDIIPCTVTSEARTQIQTPLSEKSEYPILASGNVVDVESFRCFSNHLLANIPNGGSGITFILTSDYKSVACGTKTLTRAQYLEGTVRQKP